MQQTTPAMAQKPSTTPSGHRPTAAITVLSLQSGLVILASLFLLAAGLRARDRGVSLLGDGRHRQVLAGMRGSPFGHQLMSSLSQPGADHRVMVAGAILGALGSVLLAGTIGYCLRKRWGRGLAIAAECLGGLVGLAAIARTPAVGIALCLMSGVALILLTRRGSVWDIPPIGPATVATWSRPPDAAPPAPPAPPASTPPSWWSTPPASSSSTYPSTTTGGTAVAAEKTDVASIILAVGATLLLVGALFVRSQLVFGVVILALIFIPVERLLSLHPQRVLRKGWYTDLVHLCVNNIFTTIAVVIVAFAAISGLHYVVPTGFQTAVHSQPLWLQFIEAFLASDICSYWSHRASHQVPFLWRFHAVHHSIDEMDWLASARLHPLDAAFRQACVIIPLYMLGFSRGVLGGFIVVGVFLAIFQHSNVRIRYGPLRWVVMNPQAHHWHHANEPDHYNKNFAAALPLIDVMFGTAYIPAKLWPARYGIDNPTPQGYLRQMAWPFMWNRTYRTVASTPAP